LGEAAQNLETKSVMELFKVHEKFCKCLLDGYAVVDTNGKILKCNALFSQLVGVKTKQILKTNSFEDVLTLNVSGKKIDIVELAHSPSPTRIDEVSGRAGEKDNLNLIIGIYPFIDEGQPLGAFITVRDATAESDLQDKYKTKATQSITDPLTGLFNRGYFEEYIGTQVEQLEALPLDATQRTMTVIMLDIDHFKKVNDTYGHQAGDYIIKQVSEHMKDSFRRTDILCRYGGEEFLAILPGTDLLGACIAAEKFREVIQNYVFDFEGTKIPIRMSSGVAQINVGQEKGDETISRADKALYHSKESGRNLVSFHNGASLVTHTKK
jgi:diguanylate cyclase (GGDEF)-like protein